MKRHIPGALLFAALVALAVLVNSVVSRLDEDLDVVLVPPVAIEKPPQNRTIPILVETAEFDPGSNKLVARIVVDGIYAEGDSTAAVTAFVIARTAAGEVYEYSAASFVSVQRLPGNKGVARFEANVNGIDGSARDRNLFVAFQIDRSDGIPAARSKDLSSELTPVTFVHDKNSTRRPETLR